MTSSTDREARIAELEQMLADPACRRAVAERIVALELRCEELAGEMVRVDQRLTKSQLDRWDIP
jgi:hypothetical protein